jgi:hypothetical protein
MTNETQNIKRRNHEVPRGLLKNWKGFKEGKAGFHFHDLSDFRTKFEVGEKAKFAITEYLYVPHDEEGVRNDELEDWFSTDESGLAVLSKIAQDGQPDAITNDRVIKQAIRACVALGYRNAYQFYMMGELLARNGVPVESGGVHQVMVMNAWEIYRTKFAQLLNWDYHILYDLPVNLLTNDRPFHDWTIRPTPVPLVTMSLGPSAMLVGMPPADTKRRYLTVSWRAIPARPKLAEMHNVCVLETARQWVVASTEAQLNAVAPELTKDRVENRRALDRYVFWRKA